MFRCKNDRNDRYMSAQSFEKKIKEREMNFN